MLGRRRETPAQQWTTVREFVPFLLHLATGDHVNVPNRSFIRGSRTQAGRQTCSLIVPFRLTSVTMPNDGLRQSNNGARVFTQGRNRISPPNAGCLSTSHTCWLGHCDAGQELSKHWASVSKYIKKRYLDSQSVHNGNGSGSSSRLIL